MSKKNKLSVASLGSGSKGNATLVTNGKTTVLIDCGFSLRETLSRLQKLNMDPKHIDALLVTHEHQDHIRGIGPLSRKFDIPVWVTRGTFLSEKCGEIGQLNFIQGFDAFFIEGIEVTPVSVPHDAREPCQFIFKYQQDKLAILTDLGSFTTTITDKLSDCKAMVLEFNYDEQMLWDGPYPASLKSRVAGLHGHLSNDQSIQLLKKVQSNDLQWVIASHLSEKNNCPKVVTELLIDTLNQKNNLMTKIHIAKQAEGYAWKSIA